MGATYNVYCDESCHQEHDRSRAMVIGAVWAPLEKVPEIILRLKEIKADHGKPSDFEISVTMMPPGRSFEAPRNARIEEHITTLRGASMMIAIR